MFPTCAVIMAGFIQVICYSCLCVCVRACACMQTWSRGAVSWLISKPSLSICSEQRAVCRQLSPNTLSLSPFFCPPLSLSLLFSLSSLIALTPLSLAPPHPPSWAACMLEALALRPVPAWPPFRTWNDGKHKGNGNHRQAHSSRRHEQQSLGDLPPWQSSLTSGSEEAHCKPKSWYTSLSLDKVEFLLFGLSGW